MVMILYIRGVKTPWSPGPDLEMQFFCGPDLRGGEPCRPYPAPHLAVGQIVLVRQAASGS